MDKKYLYLAILFLVCFASCRKNIEYYHTEIFREQKLYLVTFIDRGGVYASDRQYYYLTDSLTFSEYLGSVDEKGYYNLKFNDSLVTVEKLSWRKRHSQKAELIDTDIYDINNLKKKGNFDFKPRSP